MEDGQRKLLCPERMFLMEEMGWEQELPNAVGSGQCWRGVNVGHWGVGLGVGGQGRGPLIPAGTAPLSPAVQLSAAVWLSLPERSAPPSLLQISNISSLATVPG